MGDEDVENRKKIDHCITKLNCKVQKLVDNRSLMLRVKCSTLRNATFNLHKYIIMLGIPDSFISGVLKRVSGLMAGWYLHVLEMQ